MTQLTTQQARDLTEAELDTLEAMLDRTSLAGVLRGVATIAARKSDHIAHTWQDSALASTWTRAARAVERTSSAKGVLAV